MNLELVEQIFEKIQELEEKISNNYRRYQALSKKIKKLELHEP